MNNEDCSDGDEEMLVYVEFENCVDIEKYGTIHILGINEETPVIQMDNTIFTGKYENALGTYMFFEDDLEPKTKDPLFDKLPEKNLKYKCKTMKLLNMQHAHITPKEGKVHGLEDKKQESEDNIEIVNFKSLQEGLDKFKSNWDTLTNTASVKSPEKLIHEILDKNVS